MYYRLSQDIKLNFIDFFKILFTQYSEGKISFDDGRNKISFSANPLSGDLDSYDFKYFPSVMVGVSPGSFKDTHFNKYRGLGVDANNLPARMTGGIFSTTVNFNVYATSEDDRNDLSDLVCSYLTKADTKAGFLNQFGIRIESPKFSGDSKEEDPQTNVMIFSTVISLSLEADFEDATTIVDASGRTGLTVLDVISLIASQRGSGEIVGY
jgi:hypothetical protein